MNHYQAPQDDMMAALQGLGGISVESKMLDLAFVLDCTGSMGSYISSATENIELICDQILSSEKLASTECLRIALIAYRDHPPQDYSWLIKNFGFTSNVKDVKENLKSLYASGGGDGPEASTAALAALLQLDWRPTASKMAVLITDAPPHGIGEYSDGFSDGSPDGNDPLVVARNMARMGITLFCVACEPALSGYYYATDAYKALTQITSGVMLPLTTASLLAHVIVGSALEQLDMERLIKEVGQAVAERVHSGQESVDEVAKALHEKLMLRNESTKQLVVEDIYREIPEAQHNVGVFTNAENLQAAKPHLKRVEGSRFTDRWLQQRYNTSLPSYGRSYPPLPSRSARSVSPPTSPPRKVVSEFATFSAPSGMTIGSGITSSPTKSPKFGSTSAFKSDASAFGLREASPPAASPRRAPAASSAEEDDDALQNVELKLASISFDQAKRITMQSAWRGLTS